MDNEMIYEYGPECPDFDPGCVCCVGWRFYRESGEVPTLADVYAELNTGDE